MLNQPPTTLLGLTIFFLIFQEPLDLADPKLVQAIWKPEVFFPNAKEGDFQFVTMPNLLIRIHPDGEILYILRY